MAAPASAPPPAGDDDPGRPLAGLRVLDLTTFLSGPVTARTLADLVRMAEVLRPSSS